MTLGRNGKRVPKAKFRLDQRVQVSFQGTTTGTTILHKGTIRKIRTNSIFRKYDIAFDDKEKHTIEESRIRPALRGSGKARKLETVKPTKRRKSADRQSDVRRSCVRSILARLVQDMRTRLPISQVCTNCTVILSLS